MIQLINAAKTAVAEGKHKKGGKKSAASTAQKNLLMFRDAWQEVASLLSDAVDNTMSMHHFLSVSGEPHSTSIASFCMLYFPCKKSLVTIIEIKYIDWWYTIRMIPYKWLPFNTNSIF